MGNNYYFVSDKTKFFITYHQKCPPYSGRKRDYFFSVDKLNVMQYDFNRLTVNIIQMIRNSNILSSLNQFAINFYLSITVRHTGIARRYIPYCTGVKLLSFLYKPEVCQLSCIKFLIQKGGAFL